MALTTGFTFAPHSLDQETLPPPASPSSFGVRPPFQSRDLSLDVGYRTCKPSPCRQGIRPLHFNKPVPPLPSNPLFVKLPCRNHSENRLPTLGAYSLLPRLSGNGASPLMFLLRSHRQFPCPWSQPFFSASGTNLSVRPLPVVFRQCCGCSEFLSGCQVFPQDFFRAVLLSATPLEFFFQFSAFPASPWFPCLRRRVR